VKWEGETHGEGDPKMGRRGTQKNKHRPGSMITASKGEKTGMGGKKKKINTGRGKRGPAGEGIVVFEWGRK